MKTKRMRILILKERKPVIARSEVAVACMKTHCIIDFRDLSGRTMNLLRYVPDVIMKVENYPALDVKN